MTVRIINADALEAIAEVGPIDAIITDPPYSSGAIKDAQRQARGNGSMSRSKANPAWFSHDTMTTWSFSWFLRGLLTAARTVLTPGAHVYVFSDWRQTPNVQAAMESAGYRVNHCLVWKKRHYGMGTHWRNQHENILFGSLGQPAAMLKRDMGTVLDCPNVPNARRWHPTEKPVSLLERIVEAIPGDVICDPFMGSGSTGVACKRQGRSFVGIEINPEYCLTAQERIDNERSLFDGVAQ
ncbi:MAG: site-specific DNA-methyltransferase [Rhodospirillales bacterium]|nr:site-specific DNA-methyltransferase [Rhodospirillales bacterium]